MRGAKAPLLHSKDGFTYHIIYISKLTKSCSITSSTLRSNGSLPATLDWQCIVMDTIGKYNGRKYKYLY